MNKTQGTRQKNRCDIDGQWQCIYYKKINDNFATLLRKIMDKD